MNTGTALASGILVFSLYIIAVLIVARRRSRRLGTAPGTAATAESGAALEAAPGAAPGAEEFYLRNRNLGWIPLLLTTAATNFSAFTVLGLSGAGYRMGYVFYPAMALGTGFMALGMYLVGLPLREEGGRRGWITPVDLVRDRFRSPPVTGLFAACLVLFTLPYLALQPMAAGFLLESAWGLPYRAGALAVAALVALYTARGGLRSLTRTDSFHGLLLAALAVAAWVLVMRSAGGFRAAHEAVAASAPGLLGRPGGTSGAGGLSPLALAGYYLLWFLADPMFPQLGQRFLASKDRKSLERMVTVYPLVTTLLFFFTISVGVAGAALLPGLGAADSDRIWLLALLRAAGPAAYALFLLAPVSALVSTMDSQLLTLSSILCRELGLPAGWKRGTIFVIAAAGALIAMFPPADILSFLNRTSFIGYAALAPAFLGAIYSRKASAAGAMASIVAGETAVVLSGLRILVVPGLPEVFIVAALSWAAWVGGNAAAARRGAGKTPPEASPALAGHPGEPPFAARSLSETLPLPWALAFLAIPLSTLDFWNWGKSPLLVMGFPLWAARCAAAGFLLSAMFALFFSRKAGRRGRI